MNVLLPLAVVAIAGTATIAVAENSFSLAGRQPTTSSVYFDHVNSDGVGVVSLYDYQSHAVGKLLGSKAVAVGTNSGLRVQMNPMAFNDVLAVLTFDGVTMADQVVESHSRGR